MPVTITGVFPTNFQPGQNLLITSAGGFGATQPAGATATFTEIGGSGTILNSTTFVSWSDTQVVVTSPAVGFTEVGAQHYNLSLSGTGLTTVAFNTFPFSPPSNLSGTFNVQNGMSTVATTASQTAVLSNGSQIIFGSQIGVTYTVLSVSPSQITLTGNYTGTTNPATTAQTLLLVTSITPDPVEPGQTITLHGNFPVTQDSLIVSYDGPLNGFPVTSWSNTTITATLPTNIPASFPPGTPHTVGIWHLSILINVLYTNEFIIVEGPPTISSITPAQAAPNQTCTVTGSGFGATQGATLFNLNGTPVTPTFWSATSIKFVVPGATPVGSATILVGVPGFEATSMFSVAAPLALPGGTTAVRSQPVNITGSGFGATAGTLVYFSALGLPVDLVVTDWSATSIFANLPSNADFGPGFIYLILNGQTSESSIFSGFTIGSGAAGPATTPFIVGLSWVISLNVTAYPHVQYEIGGSDPFEPFPRGQIASNPSPGFYGVNWLTATGAIPTFQLITAPASDLIALGPLTVETLTALGLTPTPPVNTSLTNMILTPPSGTGGTSAAVTVTGPIGTGTPIGTVNLLVDGTQILTGSLVGGMITFAVPVTAWGGVTGNHTVTANYLGDLTHQASTSSQTFDFIAA